MCEVLQQKIDVVAGDIFLTIFEKAASGNSVTIRNGESRIGHFSIHCKLLLKHGECCLYGACNLPHGTFSQQSQVYASRRR